MTPEEFFSGHPEAKELFDHVLGLLRSIGPVELKATKSQIAFRRRKAFAWVWIPEKYLRRKTAPLVLSLAFRQRDASPRWKQIVEPYPGRFTHHLEFNRPADIDDEVRLWLLEAWQHAG